MCDPTNYIRELRIMLGGLILHARDKQQTAVVLFVWFISVEDWQFRNIKAETRRAGLMMAQYSRQVNLDASETGDVTRAVSPTCEVLGDDARTIFISPSLSYRVRYTSVWKGRSGLEKLLMVLVAVLLILCCSSFIIIFVSKQVNNFLLVKNIFSTQLHSLYHALTNLHFFSG